MTLLQIDSPVLSKRRAPAEAAARAQRRARWQHLRPDSAQIYLENRCNLKCQHCYESEESHPPDAHLSLEAYRDLLAQLRDLGVLYLTFTGGEIFLRRDVLDIVAEARRLRFHITLFTSGTLINEKKADRLAELKVNAVEVSLYSHDPAVHDAFTQIPGSHAKTSRAIELLVARGVEVVAKSNVTTFNVDALDELIAYARALGAPMQLNPVVNARHDGDQDPERFSVDPELIRTKVFNRPELYSAFKKHSPLEYCNGTGSLLGPDDAMCAAGRSTLSIGADGGLYACGMFASAAGSLNEASLEELWFEAEQLDRVRQTTFGKMSSCGSCELKASCTPCMAYSEIATGDATACTPSSKRMATAAAAQARRRVAAEKKMSGRALPLVGETEVWVPASITKPLSTEI